MDLLVNKTANLQGKSEVPGDKSISHRALLIGAMAEGTTKISGLLFGADCLATIKCLQKLGINIWTDDNNDVYVQGNGAKGIKTKQNILLNVENSGTTMRLMLGLLAGMKVNVTLTGDSSILKRPMDRITIPLSLMGARFDDMRDGVYAPVTVHGGNLNGIEYCSPVASAQIKSALLLAGINCTGETVVREPALSRDHTERMLPSFQVYLQRKEKEVRIKGGQTPKNCYIQVPGDISSAAFLLAAALMVDGGSLEVLNVGINPTRTGFLDIITSAGGTINIYNRRNVNGEPIADLQITSSELSAFEVKGEQIPRLIDEVPILALIATQAKGRTNIRDASELKIKETNRINAVVKGLKSMGAKIEETDDGMIIDGPTKLKGAYLDSYNDHRIAMAWTIAGLIAEGTTRIKNAECIEVSFPEFFACLNKLGAEIKPLEL